MAWEYKTVKGITEKEMNELGSVGWELVKIDFLGGTAIFKKRFRYIIPRDLTSYDGYSHPRNSGWGRKHPDD